jgi:hypothetical protein
VLQRARLRGVFEEGHQAVFNAPFEQTTAKGSVREIEPGVWELPAFACYAYCVIK